MSPSSTHSLLFFFLSFFTHPAPFLFTSLSMRGLRAILFVCIAKILSLWNFDRVDLTRLCHQHGRRPVSSLGDEWNETLLAEFSARAVERLAICLRVLFAERSEGPQKTSMDPSQITIKYPMFRETEVDLFSLRSRY